MVNTGKVELIHFSFIIADQTTQSLHQIIFFTNIANSYKMVDVFTIEELKSLCDQSATTFIEDGTNVHLWRDSLGEKYSNLPGVCKLHDFLFIKMVMKVREFCLGGVWAESPLLTRNPEQSGTPISQDKKAHMITMYDKFISPTRHPSLLLPLQLTSVLQTTASIQSGWHLWTSTITVRLALHVSHCLCQVNGYKTTQRKKGTCSVQGCTGVGHKSKAKWAERHTTRAGCPILDKWLIQYPIYLD